MTLKLIEGWKHAWRFWSVKLNALGLAVMGYLWFDPTAVLGIVNMMPASVKAALPSHLTTIIGGLFFGLALLSRLVSQPKAQAKIEEAKDAG
jgi:hypothetical protein